MSVGILLSGLMPQVMVLLDRVLQEAAEELARQSTTDGLSDTPPEELLAVALGKRLAKAISTDGQSLASDAATGLVAGELPTHEELIERNSVLASALGACDCWGRREGCPFCGGLGRPGWVRSDEGLYEAYVSPAVELRTSSRDQMSSAGVEGDDGKTN